jgi:zinc protease
MKLSLLSKGTRGAIVNVSLALHFGDAAGLRSLASVGEMTGMMLMRGTGARSRQQIQDEMDRLKAQIDVGGSATGAWANIETPRAGIEDALRLAVEILREPSFPSAEFELLRKERITEIEEGKSDPFQIAMTRMQRHQSPWPADDVRYVATPEERVAGIEAVTLDAVRAFHERFYGASAGEMAVVGDFDPTQAMALATELLGGWTSRAPYARLEAPYEERPPIHETLETPDKENAVFLAGLRIPMRDDDPEYPAMLLGNFMTGGGFLNSRLAERIRQKEGFSYGVRSNLFVSPWERNGWFGAFAIHAPQNSEKLETAFREEIARIVEAGFTDVEIAEAKSGFLQTRQVGRNRDGELAATLRARDELGRTFAWDGDVDRRIEELTAKQIHEAVRKHFNLAKMSCVIAGDFAGAAAREAAR